MHSRILSHACTGLGRCWLKNLLGESERDDALPGSSSLQNDETFSCSGVKAYARPSAENFPHSENFTSYGYLQHPYHRVRHHSGIVRAHDRFNGVALIASSSPSHDPTATVPSAALMVASAGAKDVLLTVMATTHMRITQTCICRYEIGQIYLLKNALYKRIPQASDFGEHRHAISHTKWRLAIAQHSPLSGWVGGGKGGVVEDAYWENRVVRERRGNMDSTVA